MTGNGNLLKNIVTSKHINNRPRSCQHILYILHIETLNFLWCSDFIKQYLALHGHF